MADKSSIGRSDEQLVVRVGSKIFVLPSDTLEVYRSEEMEKMDQKEVEEFFKTYVKQSVSAVYLRVTVQGDADFVPPSRRTRRAPRKSPSRSPRGGAKKGPRS
jgi:hypothetical protein